MNDQRFRLCFNGVDWHEYEPVNSANVTFTQSRDLENGQAFFRRKINTELIWGGDAFKRFWAIEKQEAKQCDEILVVYEERCRGRWQELWRGKFATGRGRFNLDLCEFHVTPETVDRYTCALERQGRKVNLLAAEPVTATASIIPQYEVAVCLIYTTNLGTLPTISVCPDGFDSGDPGWAIGPTPPPLYTGGAGTGTHFVGYRRYWRERIVIECAGGVPLPPAGTGWVLIENDCDTSGTAVYVRTPTIPWSFGTPVQGDCVAGEAMPPGSSCDGVWVEGLGCSEIPSQYLPWVPGWVPLPMYVCLTAVTQAYDRARMLERAVGMQVLALDCGLTGVRSDFFEWDAVGDAPGYATGINYVTGKSTQVDQIVLLQKSDAMYPSSTNPATIGEMTFKEMMHALYVMFRVLWDIDEDGYLRLEHWKYWSFPIGLDLHQQREVIEDIDFTHIVDTLPRVERAAWMEAFSRDFVGRDIVYSGPCIGSTDVNTQEKEWTPGKITTDIYFILTDPAAISKDGFAFLATKFDESQYNTILDEGAITGNYIANAPLSWANLQRDYWRWDRPYREGNMNGVDTVFDGHLPNRKQEGVGYAVCCDVHSFDPKDRVETKLGKLLGKTGIVETAEYNIHDRRMRMVLLYGGPEPVRQPVCAGRFRIGIETVGGGSVDIGSNQGYITRRRENGEINTSVSPVPISEDGGMYCVWPSNDIGTVASEAYSLTIQGGITELTMVDVPLTSVDPATPYFSLAPHFANQPQLTSLSLSGLPPLRNYWITGCPSLVAITGYDLAIADSFEAIGCALNQATVHAILSAAANAGNPITVNLSGGTSAAPSGAFATVVVGWIIANGGSVTHN